jgi:type IV secretion system protein VirB5
MYETEDSRSIACANARRRNCFGPVRLRRIVYDPTNYHNALLRYFQLQQQLIQLRNLIRIDDLGRAEAINYHNLEYKPQDAEAKYFLSQFCVLYYRKNRYTIQNDFSKALYFLDGKLADGILDAYRKDDIIKKFLTNTSAPEIDVEVKKVALEDLTSPPYKARVDFYMVYYSAADHTELKRDLYTANFVFVFKTKVPNELIPINPLGLAITYFREDEAFK